MRFKIRDRVKFIGLDRDIYVEGTIIEVLGSNRMWDYTVEFDKNVRGHSYHGKGKDGHCFWLYKSEIELIETKPMTPRESVMF